MSSVGGWNVEARDSSDRFGPASNTVTGTPPRGEMRGGDEPDRACAGNENSLCSQTVTRPKYENPKTVD